MARNRHSRRYLLPNCYQSERYRNDVKTKWVEWVEPWGDQPNSSMQEVVSLLIFENS
jgi:hypothetical protein